MISSSQYVVPTFGNQRISDIKREDVQLFLAEKAAQYSRSALRSMRVVLSLTLGWARNNGRLQQNPCEGVRLPLSTGGKTVQRTILTTEQVSAIAGKLDEPYVRPAAKELEIPIGGWHDFRHSLTVAMRRNGVHPKVISSILGHSKVALAMDVYDHANVEDFRQPLSFVADELLQNVTKNTDSA
jgi:integrase